jgi:hypothetical protein
MKKVILLLTVGLFTVTMYAQKNISLYDGIKSGMTKSKLHHHVKKDNSLRWGDDGILTTIKDRDYSITCTFNNDSVIEQISLVSHDFYEWMEYEPNVLENAKELYGLLNAKYGEPIHDKWVDWTDIPDGKYKMVTKFKKNSVNVSIYVFNTDDLYNVGVIIVDENFKDETEPQSPGRF